MFVYKYIRNICLFVYVSTFQWIELHMPTTFLEFIATKRISWFTQDFTILIEEIWLTSTMATGHKDIFRFADDAKYCLTHKFSIVRAQTLCHKLWKVHQKFEMIHLNLALGFGFSELFKVFFFAGTKFIVRNLENLQILSRRRKKLSFSQSEKWV